MQGVRIVALSIACCVVYGILHDQITARICVEYFTIGHSPVFPTQDPTLLALGWGVIATWWVGAILGVSLAMVSRLGTAPKKTARELLGPMIMLMMCSASFALLMGLVGFVAARNGWAFLVGELAERVPTERHIGFLTNLWAHNASYFAGVAGSILLMVYVWRSRWSYAAHMNTERSVGHGAADSAF